MSASRAIPKSLTLAAGWPEAGKRTLAGLMSRCSTPCRCACSPEQTETPEIAAQLFELGSHPLLGVDCSSSLADGVPQSRDRRLKLNVTEEPVEEAPLVEGQLAERVAGATVEHPPDFGAQARRQPGARGLRLRELVQHVEIWSSADPYSDDGLDPVSFRLCHHLLGFGSPSLKLLAHFRDESGRELSDHSLDRESLRWVPVEVVDFGWR